MTEQEWEQALTAAVEEVLEKMFFTGICGEALDEAPEGEQPLIARLRFVGQPPGELLLSISRPAARTLTDNFLAADDGQPSSESQLGAVVCELVNMICGSMLSKAESTEHFRLASPEMLADAPAIPAGSTTQAFDLGDGILRLVLALEEHAG